MTFASRENDRVAPTARHSSPVLRTMPVASRETFVSTTRQVGRIGWRVVSRLGVLVVILAAYSWFRKTYFQRPAELAYQNAFDIIDLQRRLGVAVTRIELPLQQRVLEHPWLVDFFNAYYRQFKPVLYICVVLCLLLAPASFGRIFRIFLVATLIALPMYALYPLAPPRLMASFGVPFVDTLAVFGGTQSSSEGVSGANQFAAMPSMHIAWTTIAAMWLATALPRRRLGLTLGVAHVSLMCVTVMVTGNHYLLDIVTGFAVAGIAVFVARFFPERGLGRGRDVRRWFDRSGRAPRGDYPVASNAPPNVLSQGRHR